MFLGLCNYYRRFIASFATIARPLTDLTRKDHPFVWSSECAAAFAALREALVMAPVL